MSRATRIIVLLIIDVIFFFVELIVGYAVGSLALVADSFHMLNDVMSLVVALYAIKLTNQTHTDSRYSYGWHRAEILAALINGVFLLALCFSIFLEAVERFFSTPGQYWCQHEIAIIEILIHVVIEISNPRLVVLVGSLGLASNIVGLFLFHEHGHDHGHKPGSVPASKTSSLSSSPTGQSTPRVAAVPQNIMKPRSRERSESYSSLYGHPAATRASMVQAAQDIARARSPSPSRKSRLSRSHSRPPRRSIDGSSYVDEPVSSSSAGDHPIVIETTPLLVSETASVESVPHSLHEDQAHGHGAPGHSHASMNMRALLLHVLGDALGNVGVIATGLVIWLTSWSFKFYFDPMISLVITAIIFSSALPLVRSTSFILLQGVPSEVSLEEVREAILAVDGVLSLHELHIWQLSETKIVASVHVMASRNHDFMPVAAKIRMVLHQHGIHSSTIQPEYHPPRNSPQTNISRLVLPVLSSTVTYGVLSDSLQTSEETSCLIVCPADQACDPSENACCPPQPTDV
ncbi:Zinc homeostasis factor 1 [Grifola frondosa]|uniref:Zinc homeostasis factor 1 n=1 Tax=Grifola frondosa TaxID=5627 RepID=A0A1C7MT06_GRIFR|nr:Zinc homeostasis factor 1 [Grifola frondosa]